MINNDKKENVSYILKRILSHKKIQFTLYMVAVLWVAVITQIIVNRVFHEDFQITEAFIKTKSKEMQSSLEVIAQYKDELLSEEEKKDIIYQIADAIGLTIDGEIQTWSDGMISEYSFCKLAKQATSEIKVISREVVENDAIKIKHYIIVRLTIFKSIASVDKYQDLIEKTLDKIGVVESQSTLQFEGNYDGALSMQEKNEIVTMLVNELQGEVAVEYDEGDLYTVYAYTGMIGEYVEASNSKMNIQIAITYNELTDKTKVYLATPLLNNSW